MRDQGILQRVSRGIYKLIDLPSISNPDLLPIGMRVANGVVCLVSALSYHEMTTQIPHEVYLALKRGSEKPRLDYPPIRFFWFSGDAFTEGIEAKTVEGVPIKIYCPAKTVADCFKYRHKIGLDVAIEALKSYWARPGAIVDELMSYARICRVEKVMSPYVEAVV